MKTKGPASTLEHSCLYLLVFTWINYWNTFVQCCI